MFKYWLDRYVPAFDRILQIFLYVEHYNPEYLKLICLFVYYHILIFLCKIELFFYANYSQQLLPTSVALSEEKNVFYLFWLFVFVTMWQSHNHNNSHKPTHSHNYGHSHNQNLSPVLGQVFKTFDFAVVACNFWDPDLFWVLIRISENVDFAL